MPIKGKEKSYQDNLVEVIMHILITVHSYAPNKDGVQMVTQYLAEGLVKKGHSIHVITYYYPDRAKERQEKINGVDVMRWDVKTLHMRHIGKKSDYQDYIRRCQVKYDVMINVGTQTALTDWLLPIIDDITIPKLLYIHSIWDFKWHEDDLKSPKKLLSKMIGNIRWGLYFKKYAESFKKYKIVIQLHSMDYSYDYFERKYRITSQIIENAAEDYFFTKEYDDSIEVPKNYIVNVSNYSSVKNQKRCIRTFYMANIPDDWSLVLIGSSKNDYYEELIEYNQTLRKQFGLRQEKQVYILTEIPREQIVTYVKRSSLYFIGSTREAFPVSLIEGMAAGIPFLSTDVGIIRYLPGGRVAQNDKELIYWLEIFINNDDIRNYYSQVARTEAINRYKISDKVALLEKYLYESLGENE